MPKTLTRKNCYLCKKSKPQKAFSKLGYDILQCPTCQIFTLDFQDNYQKFINDYYNEKFFTGSSERAGYVDYEGDSWPEEMNMRRYLTRIKRYKKKGKLLDAGCATGIFMEEAQNQGFESFGFDVSAYAVNKAKKKFKGKVKKATLSSARYKNKSFDVITLFDVIEHLKDPRTDLLKLKKFLKDDGLLLINTGDTSSPLAVIQGKDWHFFIPPQHLFFFSKKTLTKLLKQAGFKVIKIDYKGKWVSVRYFLNLAQQIHNWRIAKLLYPLVADNIIGKIPVYLNLFDNIVVYAKKDLP